MNEVAKMAETFSRLSAGRLILGLGGGYSDDEFRAFGLGTFSARDKVDGLEEAVRITRGLWSQRGFSFDGRLHRTDRAELEPKPSSPVPICLSTFVAGPSAAVTEQLLAFTAIGDRLQRQAHRTRHPPASGKARSGSDPGRVRSPVTSCCISRRHPP